MGKAFFDKIPVYCPLSKVIFRYLTGRETRFNDLMHVDEDIYKSLVYISENSIDGRLFETFSVNKEF